MTTKKSVFGTGINDIKGSSGSAYYSQWHEMLRRCYSENYGDRYPTYKDARVCQEWHHLSNFKAWMEQQEYTGCVLDKDILCKGEKVYSPETCCFVPEVLNLVIIRSDSSRGNLPIGVTVDPRKAVGTKRFVSRVGSGVRGRNIHLGMFTTPIEAHFAWQLAKALRIEDEVEGWYNHISYRPDVADALLKMAWKLRLDNLNQRETKC